MTGNVTSLEVSRRLSKVWPGPDLSKQRPWWIQWPWEKTWALLETALADGVDWRGEPPVPARDLAELEAEIRRMGLVARMEFTPVDHEGRGAMVTVAFYDWDAESDRWICEGNTDTIIDALASALAEAKERA